MILCDISAEFYLNFKFIIIKIIMYSNCSITSFKHLWFTFKNKMEMEKKKRNFMIYHFLVKRKPHERIFYWLQQAWIFTRQKNPIVMKTCFSEGKLMKQFGNHRGPTPFQLTVLYWEVFLWHPSLSNFQKQGTPLPNFRGEGETMSCDFDVQ